VIRLTQQLAEQIKQSGASVESIQVKEEVRGLREALTHEFPRAKIASDSGDIAFAVAVEADDAKHGRVIVNAVSEDLALTAGAKFVEKPWADDWTLYRNANSQKRYMLASSGQPCSSEQEALDAARKDAVDQLYPIMRDTMNANAALSKEVVRVTPEWIRNRLAYSVKSNASKVLVPDTFVQRFSRPYGEVWQASMLIDASQPNIQKLNQSYNQHATSQSKKRTSTFGALAGIAIVIGLMYAFINAVTKGYFMWRLRAVAILVVIAVVLVAFAAV
jgi:hypothetical protein